MVKADDLVQTLGDREYLYGRAGKQVRTIKGRTDNEAQVEKS